MSAIPAYYRFKTCCAVGGDLTNLESFKSRELRPFDRRDDPRSVFLGQVEEIAP